MVENKYAFSSLHTYICRAFTINRNYSLQRNYQVTETGLNFIFSNENDIK